MTDAARRQLLVFAFDAAQPRFEGHLLGALERAESGGAISVREVLFAGRDADGTVSVLHRAGGTLGLVGAVTDFRLEPAARHAGTAKALGADGDGPALQELTDGLGPGEAVAAVLVEHRWAATLDDAVARTGGRGLADERFDPAAEGLAGRVLAATREQGQAEARTGRAARAMRRRSRRSARRSRRRSRRSERCMRSSDRQVPHSPQRSSQHGSPPRIASHPSPLSAGEPQMGQRARSGARERSGWGIGTIVSSTRRARLIPFG
jgi:hypothetical protein